MLKLNQVQPDVSGSHGGGTRQCLETCVIKWVQGKDPAKHPTTHRTTCTTQNGSAPNMKRVWLKNSPLELTSNLKEREETKEEVKQMEPRIIKTEKIFLR